MRAMFTSFDNFMAVFVAMFALAWSTVFMPVLGGPLHTYEAQAIGVGWQSLRSGEATNIGEAFEIASSIPVQVVLPSAQAAEMPNRPIQIATAPDPLELLGGPDPALVILPATHAIQTGSTMPIAELSDDGLDCAGAERGTCEQSPRTLRL